MSQPPRYYGNNDLHYLTTSTYRRTPVFNSERFKREFVATLAELRIELGFRLLGYVLMPEHFHLLLWPSDGANPSQIMQRLKGRTARSILKTLRQERRHAWCARMLARFSLPLTVHDEASCRVWQRRFYDMNIWTEKKQMEKLDYMHNNPVTRGLVSSPREWPWSSWRFYFLEDESIMAMDRLP
ncbi:MAG TPA: transposase [Terriglobia bacterium]|nr:transposase [Terriglobia bacterium]